MSGDVLTSYTVYGLIASPIFQQCTEAAAYVNRTYPESFAVAVHQEVPRDYEERRQTWAAAHQLPGSSEAAPADVLVHNASTNELLTGEAFIRHVLSTTNYRVDAAALVDDHRDSYGARARQSWLDFLAARERQYCWLEVAIDGVKVGTIWLELFSTIAPLTCKNFCALCRGVTMDVPTTEVAPSQTGSSASPNSAPSAAGVSTRTQLTYKGTSFFRTLKDAWVMAGDVMGDHSGASGYSCYGRTFADETFAVPHDAPGVLGMCNDGPHTNGSSFYITRRPLSWMNRKYVAFGRVMDGMAVVDAIHAVPVKHNQSPDVKIVITDCGVLDPSE